MNAGWCANSKMPPMHVYVWMSYVPNDISYRSFVLLLLSQETHHATYIRTRKIGRSSYPPCSCVDEAIVKSESKACLEGEEWASGISSILYPLSLIVTHSPPPPLSRHHLIPLRDSGYRLGLTKWPSNTHTLCISLFVLYEYTTAHSRIRPMEMAFCYVCISSLSLHLLFTSQVILLLFFLEMNLFPGV